MLVCSIIFAEIFPIFWGRPRIETISPVVNPTVAVNHLFTVWNRYSWCKFWLFDCSDDCLHVLDTFNRRYNPRFRISKQCFPSFESPFSRTEQREWFSEAPVFEHIDEFRTAISYFRAFRFKYQSSFSEKASLSIYFYVSLVKEYATYASELLGEFESFVVE